MKSTERIEDYGGYMLVDRDSKIPAEADFALTLTDESMAPYLKKNAAVNVQAKAVLEEFDAGIFLYEGKVLCRQWCEDIQGNIHLLCANPAYEDENISIGRVAREKLICLGKVILKKKLPPPVYY